MNNIKIENLCHMNDNSIRLIRKMRTLCVTIPMYKYNDLPFFTVCCIYLVLELLVLGAMFFFVSICFCCMSISHEDETRAQLVLN